MAAAALEHSVLESKDKDTLLEMAKALGVKANSRNRKSDIIDKILDSTGSVGTPADAPVVSGKNESSANSTSKPDSPSSEPVATEPVATEPKSATAPKSATEPTSATVPKDAAASEDATSSKSSRGNSKPSAPTSAGASELVGDDGEPLADWEIALREQGVDTTVSAHNATDDRSEGDATSKSNDERSPSGERNRQRQGGRGDDNQQRSGQGQGNSGGDNRSRNNNNRNNNNDDGGGGGNSKRRRRRRKGGNRGHEGPQGEDLELLDDDGQPQSNEPVEVTGFLDIRNEGYGFLRTNGYLPTKQDAYITVKIARQYGLRKGDEVVGTVRPAQRNEKNPQLIEVKSVNGGDPEAAKKRPHFEKLTALFPDEQLRLEDPSDPANMTARIIDLISPIGKGQRGIIVSPPKAGKTTVMKTIARSIELNSPEVELLVLLIDERPEEVTDMRRSVKGEVIASTFDRPSDEHTHVAEMTIAKARRMVEDGKDVVVILDGITRLSRAYNLAAPSSGKILSGGIDAGALYPPKKFFGSARNVEEGGSLTILATALVDTNSRMDEAIFEEFKGTGNMELRLDRKVAERRIYPAIDVDASSTRHEELLFDRKQLQMVWKLRRVLSGLAADGNAAPGLELLIDRLKTFRTNAEFLSEIAKQPGM